MPIPLAFIGGPLGGVKKASSLARSVSARPGYNESCGLTFLVWAKVAMKVLVITPAGFHLGYLGCCGNAWIDTPCLDALAAESVVFDQHYSDCPCPLGAWRAWRTGRYNFALPARESSSLSPDSCDVISMLRAAKIPCFLISDATDAQLRSHSSAWQEIYSIPSEKTNDSYWKKFRKSMSESMHQLNSSEQGLVWLETNFLIPTWVVDESSWDHLTAEVEEDGSEESLEPLLEPPLSLLDSEDETQFVRLQRTYASAVCRLDRELGELWDQLRRQNDSESWMIILTTDRGFPLGEHGSVADSHPWLHEELVHLPLIVRLPNAASAGERIAALTQPVDVMPTLLEAFGLSSPEMHGSSLLPLIKGERERIRDYAWSGLRNDVTAEYSLRTLDWAFLLRGETHSEDAHPPARELQLYIKPDDRWEINNVLQHHPEVAEHLEEALRAFVKAPSY
jgi:arylsulfatase A-like enzyme